MKILILEGLHGNNKGKKCQWRLKRTNLKVGDTVVLNCHDWKIIKVIGEKKRSMFPKGAIFSEYSNLELPYKIPEYLEGLLNKNGNEFILVGNKRFGKNSFYCAFKNMLKKEVKKVRPYLEVKVVKVKKDKYKINRSLYCPCCNSKLEAEEPKGNWVNGENLDKIKFPCFGWYLSGIGKRYCELDFIKHEEGFYRVKELKQHKEKDYSHAEFWNYDLKKLIDMLDFHIEKSKIIIYEEE